jgi:predicted dinucleotide-binding enzyme
VFAGNTAHPDALGYQLDSLFATDDEAAKDAVCGLSSSIGFRPIHVGPLAASRELEAMAWLNIRLQMISNGNWNTAFALVSPPADALTYGK